MDVAAFVSTSFNPTEQLMTMTPSSKWFFVCAVPLAACGSAGRDQSLEPVNAGLAGTSGGSVCGNAGENDTLSLACPPGQTIASVEFASYGTPSGSCGAFAKGSCDATNTTS